MSDSLSDKPSDLRPGSSKVRIGRPFHSLSVRPRPAPNTQEFPLSDQVPLPEEQVIPVLVLS